MSTNERALHTIEEMAEREMRELRQRLQRSLDRGGMPTEADFVAAEAKVRDAYNALEALSFRLEGISDLFQVPEEVPFPVTSEHVGLAAGFAYIVDTDVEEMKTQVEAIREAAYSLELIRHAQRDGITKKDVAV